MFRKYVIWFLQCIGYFIFLKSFLKNKNGKLVFLTFLSFLFMYHESSIKAIQAFTIYNFLILTVNSLHPASIACPSLLDEGSFLASVVWIRDSMSAVQVVKSQICDIGL